MGPGSPPASRASAGDDDCVGRARDEPAVAGNDRRLRSIVSDCYLQMNGATRTCATGIWRSSATLAPRRETLALRSGAGRGIKSVPCLRAYHVYRTVPVPA